MSLRTSAPTSAAPIVASVSRRLRFSPSSSPSTTAVVQPTITPVDASAQMSNPASMPKLSGSNHQQGRLHDVSWFDDEQHDVTATQAVKKLTVTSSTVKTPLKVNQSYEMTLRLPTSDDVTQHMNGSRDDAASVRQPIPVTSGRGQRLSRKSPEVNTNRSTLVRTSAPTVQRAHVRSAGRRGVASQPADSKLGRAHTFYGSYTPPHQLQPRHRTSLTLQVGLEYERLLSPRYDLDRSRARSRTDPRKVVVGRSHSYSTRTGRLDDFDEDDQMNTPTREVERNERIVAVVATPTGGRGAPFKRTELVVDDDETRVEPPVTPARRQSYSTWKRLKLMTSSSSQRVESDDDVFFVRTRSRSAPQSPTSSPLLSPTSASSAWKLRRQSLQPRSRYLSSPEKLEYYSMCWRHIRSSEREQDEEMW